MHGHSLIFVFQLVSNASGNEARKHHNVTKVPNNPTKRLHIRSK
jgi:hypothetical protein